MPLFQSSLQDDPRFRMIFLVGMLLVLIGLMFYLGNLTQAYYSRYPAPEEQAMVQADGDPYRSVEPAEALNPIVFELAEFGENNPDHGANIDTQADGLLALYRWLAGRTHEDMQERARRRREWHITKLIREPSRWRGEVVHVYGMLADVETIELHQNPPGLQYLYLLRLYDQHEMEFFSVLTPEMPDHAKVFEDRQEDQWEKWGDTLACDAVFLMNLPYRRGGIVRTTPLFVTKRVYFSLQGRTPRIVFDERHEPGRQYVDIEPETTVPALDMGFIRDKLFAPPKDGGAWRFFGTDFRREASNLRDEKVVFDHVFEYLWGQDEEAIRRDARNPEINHRTIMAGNEPPSWMIGQLTRVRGLAAAVEPIHFPPGQPGLKRMYFVTVQDTSFLHPADHTWTVVVPNLPEGLQQGNHVEANGVLLKIYPYQTRMEQWKWAPLVAARSLEILPTPASPLLPSYMTRTQIYILGGVLGVVIFGIFFLMYRASQKDTEKLKAVRKRSQEARIAAQRRKLQNAKGLKQNAPPPPPPPGIDPLASPSAPPASEALSFAPPPHSPPETPAMPDVSAPDFMRHLVHRAVHPTPAEKPREKMDEDVHPDDHSTP